VCCVLYAFRAPQRPLGCVAERQAVLDCYNNHPSDVYSCVEFVDAFESCARQGVNVRRSRTALSPFQHCPLTRECSSPGSHEAVRHSWRLVAAGTALLWRVVCSSVGKSHRRARVVEQATLGCPWHHAHKALWSPSHLPALCEGTRSHNAHAWRHAMSGRAWKT